MNARATMLVAVLSSLTACRPSTPAGSFAFTVTLTGNGTVSSGEQHCSAPNCLFTLTPDSKVVPLPDPGWRFDGWSGACTGLDECRPTTKGEATARFLPVSTVTVEIIGTGRVIAPGGLVCDSLCVWQTTGPLVLTPNPETIFKFDGFGGDCQGLGECRLESGRVTATFSRVTKPLTFEFVGDGSATVTDVTNHLSCGATCTLDVPTLNSYTFSARPDATTMPVFFTGDCSGSTCTVTPPANVQVHTARGSRVTAQVNGDGALWVNGAQFCPGDCEGLFPRDAGVTLVPHASDWSEFNGFDGACHGLAGCTLNPNGTALEVTATFEPLFKWHVDVRALGTAHLASLLPNDAGIAFVSTVENGFEIDGGIFEGHPHSGLSAFARTNWAGSLEQVTLLYTPNDPFGYWQKTGISDLAQLPSGEFVAVGNCEGADINGLPCGPTFDSYPVMLVIDQQGIRRSVKGTTRPNQTYAAFTSTQGEFKAFAGPNANSLEELVDLDTDLSETEAREIPFQMSTRPACLTETIPWLCAMSYSQALTWNGCRTSSLGMNVGSNIVVFTMDPGNGSCSNVSDITLGDWFRPSSLLVRDLVRDELTQEVVLIVSKSSAAPVYFAPLSISTFDATTLLAHFSAAWTSVQSSAPLNVVQVLPARGGGVIMMTSGSPTHFFQPLGGSADSLRLVWQRSDGSIKRVWEFTGASSVARMARYQGSLVVLMTGRNVAFNGHALVGDQTSEFIHLLVFKDPN